MDNPDNPISLLITKTDSPYRDVVAQMARHDLGFSDTRFAIRTDFADGRQSFLDVGKSCDGEMLSRSLQEVFRDASDNVLGRALTIIHPEANVRLLFPRSSYTPEIKKEPEPKSSAPSVYDELRLLAKLDTVKDDLLKFANLDFVMDCQAAACDHSNHMLNSRFDLIEAGKAEINKPEVRDRMAGLFDDLIYIVGCQSSVERELLAVYRKAVLG